MTESLAAVVTKFKAPAELWRVPLPEIEPSSALIRVDAATLCGTDAHRWTGHFTEGGGDQPFLQPLTLPYIPGHETCGTIVETGGDIVDVLNVPLKPGDRIISAYAHCGHCYYCRVSTQTSLCHEVKSYGHSHPSRLMGGCSEYHYFPPGALFIRVPDNVAPEIAASAACALRTVMHSFEQLGSISSHETVLIQGCGPLGLYALAVAKDRGAKKVLVIGAPAARLEVAEQWGADHVLDLTDVADPEERVRWVRDLTFGRGADVVLNCANSHAVVEGLRMSRPGGRLVQVGISGEGDVRISPRLLFRGVQIFSTVMAGARHFYEAIEFVSTRQKHFDFHKLISNRYPLDRLSDALLAMSEFREVKPVIMPQVARDVPTPAL
ncbi:zinc-binding dehydrogenase [Mesorhizobium retamae]|uniref:Zinc-binding dehydrogenase n=1 Tax=Mesorhizobium retamae TaxID=2912854 RepID=A0ABS9QK81_9HYPH|nr:zinc-binding dehydrogenase [Mesorhizobium sp. IRAMC:0171]MCG7507859.1 zinc-binding dehydrogenase [Mesorhizobium sp. IRAMC:0171]